MARAFAAAVSLAAALWVVAVPVPVLAATTAVADLVLIPADDVLADDLYAGAGRVVVAGTVEGDVVAAAFGEVRVQGRVDGDLLVAAPTVVVTGEVMGSIRGLAGQVRVATGGVVGGDLAVTAGLVAIDGDVDGEVLGVGVVTTVGGSSGPLSVRGWSIDVTGTVDGEVRLLGRSVTIADGATVAGDVVATADPQVAEGATVTGSVRRAPVPVLPIRARSAVVVGAVVGLVVAIVAGPLLARVAPGFLRRAIDRSRRRPLAVLGRGVAFGVGPIVLVGLLVGLALAAPAVAGPAVAAASIVAMAWFVVGVGAAVLGAPAVTVAAGHLVVRRGSHLAAHVVGLVGLLALVVVPYAGYGVALVGGLLAVGAALGPPGDRPPRGWFSTAQGDGDEQDDGGHGGDGEDPGPE